MGQYDKDRHQKELAIRYCLARGIAPFLEVIVSSVSDLSSTTEVLTDLDVLGLEFIIDGGFRRTIFDCKTSRMSAVNLAFWAAGVAAYTRCDDAFVILKNRAVHNHRISALAMKVDLHDERSFEDFGKTFDLAFNADTYYQSSIDRWNVLFENYSKNKWSELLFGLLKSAVPLTYEPWTIFRKVVAEMRALRGHFDPDKAAHVVIFFDLLGSLSILWSLMGRDMRRFYTAGMSKEDFSEVLRYYIWGGRESFVTRREMREKFDGNNGAQLDFPAWDRFLSLSGLVIAAPQEFFRCSHICREIAFRKANSATAGHDALLRDYINRSKRLTQFVPSLAEYLVHACALPKDFVDVVATGLRLT